MTPFKKYYQAVDFLESIMNLPIKDYLLDLKDRSFYIARLNYLLKLLGNPQKDFKFIHITGTSGKGSTANNLHEILRAAGIKVGSYFSPHPTTAIERIKVNGLYIAPAEFAALIDYLKPFLEQAALKSPFGQPSYFETFLALALLYFKKQKCGYVILEAGLGGTHDATNIIKSAKLALITNIDLEHTDVLGKTLSKIAQDKAGIIKKDSIFITTETRPHLLRLFRKRCQAAGAEFINLTAEDKNGALAKEAAGKLKIAEKFICLGLKKAKLPCRFETVQNSPRVIIDGAHNPAKLEFLAAKIKRQNFDKLHLIMGMAGDKNHIESLKQIVPLADSLALTRFLMPYRKTAGLDVLYNIAKKIKPKLPVKIFVDPWEALENALNQAKSKDLILITGSFFLAGELRQKWIPEEYILKHRTSFKI